MTLRYAGVILLTLVVLVITGCDRTDQNATTAGAIAGDSKTGDVEWVLHGNDFGEQRYSRLKLVNRNNAANLGLDWYFDMPSKRGVEATPLMVDRTLFVSGSWSIVYALDAVTGALKWTF